MAKKMFKVGVLMGGPSAEREISLITGQAIFDNLDRKKYAVSKIVMAKDSTFDLEQKNGKNRKLDFVNKDRKLFDIIFLALHGTPGEDGTIQGMFDMLGIKYTGPETLSSALAMNKVFAAEIYVANGLPTPEFVHFKKDGWKDYREKIISDIENRIGYPAVVKPVDQGSAVGVGILKTKKDLLMFIDKTIKKFPWLMVQKYIRGKEGTCGVIETERQILPLPPTHILANKGEFYDYKSKYSKGGSTHICPADFPADVNKKMQELAIQAHRALGCRGMSRTDIFYVDMGKDKHTACKEDGCACTRSSCHCDEPNLYIIETNTIPGMTPVSLFPEAAGKLGISFSEMLDMIIEASM